MLADILNVLQNRNKAHPHYIYSIDRKTCKNIYITDKQKPFKPMIQEKVNK